MDQYTADILTVKCCIISSRICIYGWDQINVPGLCSKYIINTAQYILAELLRLVLLGLSFGLVGFLRTTTFSLLTFIQSHSTTFNSLGP